MGDSIEISVIVPVYGCASCVEELYERLGAVLSGLSISYEIIMINDASPDQSWETIEKLAIQDPKLKAVNLSKNYGQHYAISAGFDIAKGQWVVSMDCDLQDLPEEIPKLYMKAKEGFNIVYGYSRFRGRRGYWYTKVREFYYTVLDWMSGNSYKTTNLAFYIVSNRVVHNIRKYREHSRHLSSLIRDMGFDITGVQVEHREREHGESSYTFLKRLKLAVIGIIAYSSTLLKVSLILGFLFSLMSFVSAGYLIFQKLFNESYTLPGWASIITAILLLSGLILVFLGILGLYIERIFLEVKNRPLYIIKETINVNSDEF
jgi:polyisoprenyl-phosphate glycosyltransferase